jgi:heptosyltransferase-1
LKILIIKPSSLGDVVHALPVLRLLRRRFPDATIDWWVQPGNAPLLEGDVDLDRWIPFKRKEWGTPMGWKDLFTTLRSIRRQRYDWVIDLQALARTGALAWLSGGQLTIGLHDMREFAPLLYDRSVARRDYHTHAVDWYLDVLRTLEVPVDSDFEWIKPQAEVVSRAGEYLPTTKGPIIGLQPGARWLNKRWPTERFKDLTKDLLARFPQCTVVVFGGKEDAELGERILPTGESRCRNLAGKTSLLETVEVIRKCSAMISNDTGPMHIAVAVGTPVFGLFGPTEPSRTGPYGQLDRVIRAPTECSPCMKSTCYYEDELACLKGITTERVLQRIVEHLRV